MEDAPYGFSRPLGVGALNDIMVTLSNMGI